MQIEKTVTICQERGLKAVNLGGRILQYALAKYDRQLRCFTTDSALAVADYLQFDCKKKAIEFARSVGITAKAVEKFGQRHNIRWGVREGTVSHYFMASHDLKPAGLAQPTQPK